MPQGSQQEPLYVLALRWMKENSATAAATARHFERSPNTVRSWVRRHYEAVNGDPPPRNSGGGARPGNRTARRKPDVEKAIQRHKARRAREGDTGGIPRFEDHTVRAAIIRGASCGLTYERIAGLSRTPYTTLRGWIQKGNKARTKLAEGGKLTESEERHVLLVEDIEHAREVSIADAMGAIKAAWHPQKEAELVPKTKKVRKGTRTVTEQVTGDDGKPVMVVKKVRHRPGDFRAAHTYLEKAAPEMAPRLRVGGGEKGDQPIAVSFDLGELSKMGPAELSSLKEAVRTLRELRALQDAAKADDVDDDTGDAHGDS